MNAALLALIAMQAITPAAPCGCALFSLNEGSAAAGGAIVSDSGRAIRDFALYSHRRIAEDLIRKRGVYLDTLLDYFPHCPSRDIKLAWLRQLLSSTSDTLVFAERIAQQHETSRACIVPAK